MDKALLETNPRMIPDLPQKTGGRLVYEKPELVTYGKVAELTAGGSAAPSEFSSHMMGGMCGMHQNACLP